jgi:hypothetical protein
LELLEEWGPEAIIGLFAKIVASTPNRRDQDLRIVIDKYLLTTMQEHSVTFTWALIQRAGIAALKNPKILLRI